MFRVEGISRYIFCARSKSVLILVGLVGLVVLVTMQRVFCCIYIGIVFASETRDECSQGLFSHFGRECCHNYGSVKEYDHQQR